ncbi:hypothetical protein M569_00908, partial [Genlisea aurea]
SEMKVAEDAANTLEEEEEEDSSDSDSDSESESEPEAESKDVPLTYTRADGKARQLQPEEDEDDNSPEANIRAFMNVLTSKRLRRAQDEEDKKIKYHEDLYDFPPDPDNWTEEDLKELWADAPIGMTKTGWDPSNVDDDELDIIREEIKEGRDPPIAPFYVPYRKPYPVIPDNHYDIRGAKGVIHELDRIEEFLKWVSYIFPDGSSYEGTVWDDRAHGKGVYVAVQGLVRYEGEWLQNDMEGHGVVEVEIPVPEPVPGSKLEAKMKAEGRRFARDFMSPEDRKWLEMDIEDCVRLADGQYEIPWYENEEWIRQFGQKPEKGRYRYAGQWKHGRMHGCGVYTVNERTTWGRFYFGELMEEIAGCDADVCAMHAGIAEVAAAKARMFVNKPDGMIREYYGPFSDPQHPYFYEEDDVWMAPGFINQFYQVPDHWETYVQEVDKERELWLNSFYKAPLRLPMPAELEHWWSKYKRPEFALINKDPKPDPNDPSKLIYTDDPYILHTPTGRLIDYIEDDEHGLRFYWVPDLNDEGDVDLEKVAFLPLGFDEFYGKEDTSVPEDTLWIRFLKGVSSRGKLLVEKVDKWMDEIKKSSETRLEKLKEEAEMMEDEMDLEDEMDELDAELQMLQEEEERKMKLGIADKEEEEIPAV